MSELDAMIPEINVPTVPTRAQIDTLQREMSKFPQCTDIKTDHIFHAGMYCRKVWRPAGTCIVGRVHKSSHLFLCVSGEIVAWSETGMRHLTAGDVIQSEPGTKRVTYALTDATVMTVHRTDVTDVDQLEAELLEPDASALYDIHNPVIVEKAFAALKEL